MIAGKSVKVVPKKLFITHPGIRIDPSHNASYSYVEEGTKGVVRSLSENRYEALIDLDLGYRGVLKIWVKREWFGSLFEYVT